MGQADNELNRMIAQLRGIPDLVEKILPEVADECHAVIADNIAAQVGPDGTRWPMSKNLEPVLVNAAQAVTASAIGNVILIRVTGPEARHHLGIAKGKVKREIIPTRKIPKPMVEAMQRVINRHLEAGK